MEKITFTRERKRCVGGRCKVMPKKARYYQGEDLKKVMTLHAPTYGDIIRKGDRLYIVDKNLVPRVLRRDKCKKYVIPQKYRNDLGAKHWSRIPGLSRLKLEERRVCELRELARERGITVSGNKTELIAKLRGTGRCYESMTRGQLLERAKKRGIKDRNKMRKEELIRTLRK